MDVLRGPRQRNHASRTTGSSDTEPRPPDFDALHERKHDKRAQFYAFDMLAGGGEDVRPQALALRKANFARLLKRTRRHLHRRVRARWRQSRRLRFWI
jgi:ATP-dependent DNA ligase